VTRIVRLPGIVAVALIRLYQLTLGRLVGTRCRFHPTCSEYAVGSIRANGLIRGGVSALWRIVRCAPWTAGGLDPVKHRRQERVTARG
jgi:putative membrane protein insertion efficiency factor